MSDTAPNLAPDRSEYTGCPGSAHVHRDVFEVGADRLSWEYSSKGRTEGDIRASYSADRIGLGKPVRRPFIFRGRPWVCTGCVGGVSLTAQAYQLISQKAFVGQPQSYSEKTRDAAAARSDPRGFYHGIMTQHRGKPCVLSGPPASFIAGAAAQLDLFKQR